MGIDRGVLVARICAAFAHQIYQRGLFNADPHPGNIMVARLSRLIAGDPGDAHLPRLRRALQRASCGLSAVADADSAAAGGGAAALLAGDGADADDDGDSHADEQDEWIPVVLDFGLTKRLPDRMRLAFGKLVIAAEEMDFAAMMEAMDDMGMTFSRESAVEDLENLQYMFRDATPASEARAKYEERERAKKEKADRAAAEAAAAASSDAAGGGAAKQAAAARKVTAWPAELMFFLRVSELLQGLCAQLETRHAFMHTMAHAARLAATERFPREQHARHLVLPPEPGVAASPLEAAIRRRLATLRRAGAILGMQVAVVVGGRAVAAVAAGIMGPTDPRPVTPTTLFPCYGVSRLGVAAAIQSVVSAGGAAFDQRVDAFWPAFSAAGKSGCTVGELLRCRSGVEGKACKGRAGDALHWSSAVLCCICRRDS
jgi:aarF domain-containing kinase